MNYVQPKDWEKVLLLIDASIQAYRAFDQKPKPAEAPPGYEILDRWTGVDSVFGEALTVETYGIVLRSIAAPYRHVFAFRGTASFMDILDDLEAPKRAFTPFDPGVVVPAAVQVERGFCDVYREDAASTPSMQQQVFALLDRYAASHDRPLHELWITGHSLGAALSELFSLDVALQRGRGEI